MEYLLIHKAPRGNRYDYELLYDGKGRSGETFLSGLIDVDQLKQQAKHPCDGNRSGLNESRSGSGRPLVGVQSDASRSPKNGEKDYKNSNFKQNDDEGEENAIIKGYNNEKSYHSSMVMLSKAEEL